MVSYQLALPPGRPAARRNPSIYSFAAVVAAGIALTYAAINFAWAERITSEPVVTIFVAQPLMWLALAGVVVYASRRFGIPMATDRRIVWLAVVIGIFHASVLFATGFLVGFGVSPFARTWPMLPLNIAYFASSIMGLELARGFLLQVWRPKSKVLPVAVLGLAFAALTLSIGEISGIRSVQGAGRLVGSGVLPVIGEHSLATYLSLSGGAVSAIAYRLTTQAIWWLSPALPNLPWMLAGAAGIAIPFIGMKAVRSLSAPQTAGSGWGVRKLLRPWAVATIVSVLFLWFGTGVFPYRPLAVGGDSMSPTYELGDLVVIHRVDLYDIEVSDVIQYQMPQGRILHRVIEVEMVGDKPFFTTQGDANVIADPEPVAASQVSGRAIVGIPEVGWIGLFANKFFSRAMEAMP